MKGIISYYGFGGYEYNSEPLFIIRTWKFNSNDEFKIAMELINEDDILDIEFID